ncbi:MAG: orotidine-5'-phosphate decarboxylase [Terrimesophilobacter sp.]
MPEFSFGQQLHDAITAHGPLCVGIDPHPFLLHEWGLPDSPSGVRDFGLRVVEAAVGRVAIVKPQVAFFERHGSSGYAALETVMNAARAAGILVIADAKRGDVGSTLSAYAQAWLTPGSALEADAMTVSAFQGVGSLESAVALATEHGKGLFVLAATSNPEAAAVQKATLRPGLQNAPTVASSIVAEVIALNAASAGDHGSFGVVLGATVALSDYGISLDALAAHPSTPILAPGFGHQGAAFAEIPQRFGRAACVIVSASRSILSAGPSGVDAAMDLAAKEIAECLA